MSAQADDGPGAAKIDEHLAATGGPRRSEPEPEPEPEMSKAERRAAKQARKEAKEEEKTRKAEEKQAKRQAKEDEKARKEEEKARKKREKEEVAERKAAKEAAEAAAIPGLVPHAQRPTVPPLPLPELRPALDAVHDAIRDAPGLRRAEEQTAQTIGSIHDDLAELNIDGERSVARHLIQHVRDHKVEIEPTGPGSPASPAVAEASPLRRPEDEAALAHKVARELHTQIELLRRPVFIDNGVREFSASTKWRLRCKKCCCGLCRRSRHLLYIYAFVIVALTSLLGLVEHVAAPILVFALWVLPGVWTPVALFKSFAGCRDAHGSLTLEFRVQAAFWFGMWLGPLAIFFAPMTCWMHGSGVASVVGLCVSLASLCGQLTDSLVRCTHEESLII